MDSLIDLLKWRFFHSTGMLSPLIVSLIPFFGFAVIISAIGMGMTTELHDDAKRIMAFDVAFASGAQALYLTVYFLVFV